MSLTLTSKSRIFMFADSLALFFTSPAVPWQCQLGPLIRAAYQPTFVPGATVANMPTFVAVNALAGRSAFNSSAGFATNLLDVPKSVTHIIVQLGINDADAIRTAAETINQFSTSATTIRDLCVTAVGGANVAWIGPWSHDSGDDATQIAQVDAACAPLMTAVGGTYIRWSDIASTISTFSASDGTHPLAAGAALLSQRVLANLILNP